MAAPIAGNKVGVIGSGGASDKRRQLTRMRRARASAYSLQAKIFRASRAIGRVATNFSRFRMNIRASVFAAWSAA
jgi:imidazole glycerol phosphate synthase subunit HisF